MGHARVTHLLPLLLPSIHHDHDKALEMHASVRPWVVPYSPLMSMFRFPSTICAPEKRLAESVTT